MKLLILLIPFSLFAYTLPNGAKGISQLEDFQILNLIPETKCEKGICTLVELEFILYGCMDELGPVYLKVKQVEERYIVFLNPLNIHMRQSDGVTCFVPKKVKKLLELPKEVNEENLFFSILEEQ
jgi:hypothetical protein